MLYTLNLSNEVYQLYLNTIEKKKVLAVSILPNIPAKALAKS